MERENGMNKQKYNETVAVIQINIMRMKRGLYSIEECEQLLNQDIADAMSSIMDIDERLDTHRKLKRKAWRMLLDATRR